MAKNVSVKDFVAFVEKNLSTIEKKLTQVEFENLDVQTPLKDLKEGSEEHAELTAVSKLIRNLASQVDGLLESKHKAKRKELVMSMLNDESAFEKLFGTMSKGDTGVAPGADFE